MTELIVGDLVSFRAPDVFQPTQRTAYYLNPGIVVSSEPGYGAVPKRYKVWWGGTTYTHEFGCYLNNNRQETK